MNIDQAFPIFASPARTIEAAALLQAEKKKLLPLRGKKGESLLHWAALTELSLTLDLLGLGADINLQDAEGLTPLDWLANRIYFVFDEAARHATDKNHQSNPNQLVLIGSPSEAGKTSGANMEIGPDICKNILEKTENIAPQVILHGGKAKEAAPAFCMTGATASLLAMHEATPENWTGLGPDKFHVLHFWPLCRNQEKAKDVLKAILSKHVDINVASSKGITPLHVAVEQWSEGQAPGAYIKHLKDAGADEHLEDNDGHTCHDFAYRHSLVKIKELEELLHG